MKKIFTLFLGVALTSSMSAQSIKMLGFGDPELESLMMSGLDISPNGKYACGAMANGSGYFLADLENNTIDYQFTEDPEGAELRHVDNNGLAIGYNGPGITYSLGGVETVLKTPSDEYKYVLGEDLSADGSVMVGSLIGTGFVSYAACSKDGGEWTLLPTPDESILGDYAGHGSSAKYISGDGKVILGFIGSFGPGILWMADDNGDYVVDPVFDKYMIMNEEDAAKGEKVLYGLSPMGLSNNGKYAIFQGVMVIDENEVSVPVIYDTESKSITIYSEPQEIDEYGMGLLPTAIADDGTFVGIIGTMPFFGSMGSFIWKGGESQASTLCEAFPVYAEKFAFPDAIGYCLPTSISADGKYILGYGYYSEDFENEELEPIVLTYILDTDKGNGVESIKPSEASSVEQIYSIDGTRLDRLSKGINIVRLPDGSTRKILK